ncbi:antimicrobial peptide system protein, SdpB family [Mycobacteroides abscessus subsp. abscessus]|uniref:sporulation-delaying protein SdpB family protein n=1 Tax=Mycobacteroides abscessus TaxID=36809 RepID=UPI0009288A82|nr:sporulation-delaying protein SdpB family protein [Mycobacteroides abscessus]SIE35647.1 antimicrobial peptide system protein, SdpB family [Mycobacteroides abscessus subsp. abscessus]SKV16479.1 antimicrobial peptide system protein, SdpB family [Mycobacteroides abscessus subsp. abscessus]
MSSATEPKVKTYAYQYSFISRIVRFDHRNLWFAIGRSTLAAATLSEIWLTPLSALFHPVGGVGGPRCFLGYASLYCMPLFGVGIAGRTILLSAVLILVIIGYRPRLLALPHLWATLSISTSITLPDGGDAIALIFVLLLTPLCLIDSRTSHWRQPSNRMRVEYRALGYVISWVGRIQLAFIYAHSAISKMGVEDWANGTAFYYFARDKMFGSAGILSSLTLKLSALPFGVVAITWGAIVLELVMAVGILATPRIRAMTMYAAVGLHTAIFFALGLFSFSAVMVGVSVLSANPDRAALRDSSPGKGFIRSDWNRGRRLASWDTH